MPQIQRPAYIQQGLSNLGQSLGDIGDAKREKATGLLKFDMEHGRFIEEGQVEKWAKERHLTMQQAMQILTPVKAEGGSPVSGEGGKTTTAPIGGIAGYKLKSKPERDVEVFKKQVVAKNEAEKAIHQDQLRMARDYEEMKSGVKLSEVDETQKLTHKNVMANFSDVMKMRKEELSMENAEDLKAFTAQYTEKERLDEKYIEARIDRAEKWKEKEVALDKKLQEDYKYIDADYKIFMGEIDNLLATGKTEQALELQEKFNAKHFPAQAERAKTLAEQQSKIDVETYIQKALIDAQSKMGADRFQHFSKAIETQRLQHHGIIIKSDSGKVWNFKEFKVGSEDYENSKKSLTAAGLAFEEIPAGKTWFGHGTEKVMLVPISFTDEGIVKFEAGGKRLNTSGQRTTSGNGERKADPEDIRRFIK